MSAERILQQTRYLEPTRRVLPVEEMRLENGASIDQTWRPLDEARFLQNNPNLTPAQADKYLERSALNFINEHSFRVPFSYFLGQLSPQGHMDIQGTNMSASWAKARERFGEGSNEYFETQGYERAHEMLRAGASGAIISSPQQIDNNGVPVDRRFSFVLIKGNVYGSNDDYVDPDTNQGEWFTQINLMHEGDQLPFDIARSQYTALEHLTGQPELQGPLMQANKDILTRPIALTDSSPEALGAIFGALGIGQDAISRSLELQAMAKDDPQLSEDIQLYKRMVRELSLHDLRKLDHDGEEVLKVTEALRNSIYIRANELYMKYQHRDSEKVRVYELPTMTQEERISYYRQREDPRVYGGISCPSASSSDSIAGSLKGGNSMSKTLGEKRILCCKCPKCEKEVEAEIAGGKIHCPNCNATAKWSD